MFKLKNVLIPAVAAFLLSFLISIISTRGDFSFSLLRAVLFFFLFGLLGFGISFLNDRFLSTGESYASSGEGGEVRRTSGNVVDIVINDENLSDDGTSPSFNVERNSRTLAERDTAFSDSKTSKDSSDLKEKSSPSYSQPSSLQEKEETLVQSSDTGFEIKEGVKKQQDLVQKVGSEKASQLKEIDDLPEIGASEEGSLDEDSFIENSDFASMGENAQEELSSAVDSVKAKDHDTETMAKAIRTLLKRE